MKGSFVTIVVIIILSLIVWTAFYFMTEPLKSDQTVVVVGICAVLVLFGKWVLGRVRKRKVKNEQKT